MVLGDEEIKEINRIMSDYISEKTPGLALLVGEKGRVAFKKGFGCADIEKNISITPDTAFFIASISKQFTTMAVMMLRERGLLEYDEPISGYFPDFPSYKDKVTVRHLMTHTAGLKDYFDDEFIEKAHNLGDSLTQEMVLESIKGFGDLEFEPGTSFSYSNSGYVMLGAIVEMLTGKTFAEFLKENIFEPLGMRRTIVGISSTRLIDNLASGYEDDKGNYIKMPMDMATIGWADGNVISTVEDLFIWHNALYTEKLVKRKTLEEAFTPYVLKDGTRTGYGFGWFIGNRRGLKEIWHTGGTVGYISRFSRFVDEDVAVIMLTNNYSWAGIKRDEIFGRVINCVLKEKLQPLSFVKFDRKTLEEKTGSYVNKGGKCDCIYEGGIKRLKISCDMDRLKGEFYLDPTGPDSFRIDSPADYHVNFLRQDGSVNGVEMVINGMTFRLKKA